MTNNPAPDSINTNINAAQVPPPPPSPLIDTAVTSSTSTRARAISTLPPPVAHAKTRRPSPIGINKYTLFLVRRLLSPPLLWVVVFLLTLLGWWGNAGGADDGSMASKDAVQLRLRQLFPPEVTRDLQFYPASNHKIHVGVFPFASVELVGRIVD